MLLQTKCWETWWVCGCGRVFMLTSVRVSWTNDECAICAVMCPVVEPDDEGGERGLFQKSTHRAKTPCGAESWLVHEGQLRESQQLDSALHVYSGANVKEVSACLYSAVIWWTSVFLCAGQKEKACEGQSCHMCDRQVNVNVFRLNVV